MSAILNGLAGIWLGIATFLGLYEAPKIVELPQKPQIEVIVTTPEVVKETAKVETPIVQKTVSPKVTPKVVTPIAPVVPKTVATFTPATTFTTPDGRIVDGNGVTLNHNEIAAKLEAEKQAALKAAWDKNFEELAKIEAQKLLDAEKAKQAELDNLKMQLSNTITKLNLLIAESQAEASAWAIMTQGMGTQISTHPQYATHMAYLTYFSTTSTALSIERNALEAQIKEAQ